MATHLGKTSFLDTPDVNGVDVLTSTTLPSQLTNLVVPGTEGFTPPSGTTAQRPVVPLLGETRYNTTLNIPETYYAGTWLSFGRVLQTVTGTIAANTGTANKITTTVPLTTEGILLWSQTFTPLVVGSRILIQFRVTAAHATAARQLYASTFVGTTCIGMTTNYVSTASAMVNLIMQCVYVSVSTTPITITSRAGTINGTNAISINQTAAGTGITFGGALLSPYQILEVI